MKRRPHSIEGPASAPSMTQLSDSDQTPNPAGLSTSKPRQIDNEPNPSGLAVAASSENGTTRREQDRMDFYEGAGDDLLLRVDEHEAQPPEVTYHHGEPYSRSDSAGAHRVQTLCSMHPVITHRRRRTGG